MEGEPILKHPIQIREAVSEEEIRFFWNELHAFHARDIFPDPQDEDRDYFLNSPEYPAAIQKLHDRPADRAYYLLFSRDGQDIGFALPVLYTSQDGKCFLLEFGVFPPYRGGQTGKACAQAFLSWAADNGACYTELNYGNDERRLRFWQAFGFRPNGRDEWGEPLLLLPPAQPLPVTVERLSGPPDWQLLKLENGYLAEIGEEPLSKEGAKRLKQAVCDQKITFFLAKRGTRAVGMCSIVSAFSTFCCCETAVFEDFYVEPVFRGAGIARLLADAACQWCREQGFSSLTVCCAPCDEAMYQSLGFQTRLGSTWACLL
jgi:GNAT superfamily N-acetyltransferase